MNARLKRLFEERGQTVGLALLLAASAVVLLRNAWVGDDAYISFRAVDNFVNGHGLRWNVAERVQAFTNPLWTLLLAVPYALTREIYFTSIAVSLALTLFSMGHVFARHAKSAMAITFAAFAFVLSRAFVDYGVSGLENPLSYALTTLFMAEYLGRRNEDSPGRPRVVYAIAALAAVNRLDAIVLFLPAIAETIWQNRKAKRVALLDLAFGFAPLAVWEAFSITYYGFAFPNTYYAKLYTGIPLGEYVGQGLLYFEDLAKFDRLTLIGLVAGIVVALAQNDRRTRALGLGLCLHCAYVIRVGGDFMAGRFVANAYVAAIILAARALPERTSAAAWTPAAFAVVVGLLAPRCPLFTTVDYGFSDRGEDGIADEKGHYYGKYGLLRVLRMRPRTGTPLTAPTVYKGMVVGRHGFDAGPNGHLVDALGLTDPFLARLPAPYTPHWRIGHFTRDVPPEYLDSLRSGKNEFVDEDLHALWDDIVQVTRGELFTFARFRTIARMNTSKIRLDPTPFRFPGLSYPAQKFVARVPDGTPSDAPNQFRVSWRGVFVEFPEPRNSSRVEVSFDHDDRIALVFLLGRKDLGVAVAVPVAGSGLVSQVVETPKAARREGFDRVYVLPFRGDGSYPMGHFVPSED